ncbi:protein FAR-RED IMPAIRED RESPONSE 1-like [Tripterygium wilfordii]|uniref:protein FAR-RED IMPAIRED RESPONSE 1-like n=1 Tax=Tripterygium wilfordii TaxID=458696 RepID=UPI0018F82E6C|nr:protein FAR-RED IMPAIRED RESPONSE 1-like [Tripterygium wilfordii]
MTIIFNNWKKKKKPIFDNAKNGRGVEIRVLGFIFSYSKSFMNTVVYVLDLNVFLLDVIDVDYYLTMLVMNNCCSFKMSFMININQLDCVNDCVETGTEIVGSNVPVIGMMFESVDEMFKFYKKCCQVNGFSVKRRSLTKDANGDYKYMIFSCRRSNKFVSRSKNPVNHRGYNKNECKARRVGRLSVDGKWKITLFEDVHNHDLSPSHSRFFTCNREINPSMKRQLEIDDIAGIRPNKSFNSFVIGADGHDNIQFLERDIRNLLARTRRLHLDPRSRATYHEFGDVITFDTTYLTNNYDMPFAPFVGVNHHGHSILLGCGLISSEDTKTFVWLFRTWLECMGGVAPHGIITDQDRAMKNAIEIVFPNTKHRLCLWHIMKKVPKKFGSHREYESIKRMLAEAVYDSHSIDEFQYKCSLLIYLHNLDGNSWLENMYLEKEKWVPIYVKKYFCAGTSTTGQSESMNVFFDGYVNSKTTLKQFVEQYGNALRKKIEKECQADFDSSHK